MVTIDLALTLADADHRAIVIGEVLGRLFILALILGLLAWSIVKLVKKPPRQGPPPYPPYSPPQWPPGPGPYWPGQQPPPLGGQWPPPYPQQPPPGAGWPPPYPQQPRPGGWPDAPAGEPPTEIR